MLLPIQRARRYTPSLTSIYTFLHTSTKSLQFSTSTIGYNSSLSSPSFRFQLGRTAMSHHPPRDDIKKEEGATTKKPPLTHFLCIPLVTPTSSSELARNIHLFREDVRHIPTRDSCPVCDQKDALSPSSSENPSVIPERAIRPVGTLHLTLGVMSLTDPAKLALAKELLSRIDIDDMLQHSPESLPSSSSQPSSKAVSNQANAESLVISLKSLHSMHPAHKTSILYTSPSDPTSRLQHFCESLRSQFQANGLLVQDSRPLKLHATIVNTIYAKGDRSRGHGPNARAPLRLDATHILSRYEHFVWAGNVLLDRVAICEMGARKVPIVDERGQTVIGEEGQEYKEVATISLLPSERDHYNRLRVETMKR